MSYKILSTKPQSIFTLETIKHYLRISHNDDDNWITELLEAAISTAENFMRIKILETHVSIKFVASSKSFRMPITPIAKILSVTVSASDHNIDLQEEEYTVCNDFLRLTNLPLYDSLSIKYIAGYLDQKDLSAAVKQGILLHISEMYDNRGSICTISNEVQKLYQPYRRILL